MRQGVFNVILSVILLSTVLGFKQHRIPTANRYLTATTAVSTHVEEVEVRKEKKYIVVTGGVISGIGKGRNHFGKKIQRVQSVF